MKESENSKVKKDNPHKGHRSKVKKRYFENGLNGMPDHNVLELLLFFGIPYRDTNEMAHELIDKFGSFSGVLEADPKDLMSVKGMTENAACLLNLILPVYKRYSIDQSSKKPYYASSAELAEFIRTLYLDTTDERVYAIFFDSRNRMIGSRIISEGDIDSCRADLRKLASVALEVKANSVIIAHNHPHAITAPSRADIDSTIEIYKLLATLKVRLLNHIIVNEDDYFSMAETPKYSYIFSGLETPPYESDIDRELEYVKGLVERKNREDNIRKARERAEKLSK